MTGEAVPPTVPANVTQRDLWLAISELRAETRDARHAQANDTQRVIAELDRRLDERLRSIERVIDSANPISLGPRINDMERWQSRLDADDPGGAPARMNRLETWRDEMRGGYQTMRAVSIGLGTLATILGILAYLKT